MTERTSSEAQQSQTPPSRQRRLHLREVTTAASNYDGLGADIKAARVRNGLDLAEVAEELCIRRTHLHAIEEGLFDDLPAPVYAIGFVRSYADYLGLDGEIAVEAFKQEASGLDGETKLVFPSPILESRIPSGWLIAISLVLAGLIYAGWYYAETNGRLAIDRVPPVPERLAAVAPAPATTTPADAEPVPVGPVETEEAPAEGPTTTDLVTGINPATREVRVELRQVGGSATEQQGESEAVPDGRPPPASLSSPQETTVDSSELLSAAAPLADGMAPATDTSVVEPVTAILDKPTVTETTSQLRDPATVAASFGSMESTLSEQPTRRSETDTETATFESRAPPASATPPPQTLVDAQSGQTLPGPSQHEVPVDAVSDDPYRVDLETLPSVTASLIKPKAEPPASGDSLAAIAVEPSEFSQVAAATPQSDTPQVPEIPALESAPSQDSDVAAAAAKSVPATDTTEETPVAEVEPQVASTSATLGLTLSERQPRIYGEGNWDARVVVKATGESWVQVMDRDGGLLLTRILRPGDQYLVPNRDDLVLMTGNAGGIEITVDGKTVAAIGEAGAVRHSIVLVPDRLLAGTAVER